MFYSIGISFFLVFFLLLMFGLFFSIGLSSFWSLLFVSNNYFVFDNVSFYMIFLVLCLGLYSQFLFVNNLSVVSRVFLVVSVFFSILSFCVNHSILFWCFYELSMLPLLYLIFFESPYSERFLAGWYFACYLLITSVPLVLILLYLSLINCCFFFNMWCFDCFSLSLFVLLSFVFFTKVPLFPFHTWLPMVHAEATSMVSIFLSGYIMKLGLLGVYRCCYFIFNNFMFCYLFVCMVFSVGFLLTCVSELDGKRWLAFISLGHIVVPFVGFFVCDWVSVNISFFYCLGHGLSAGLVFCLLWYLYDVCNSRNWLLLKSCINGKFLMIFVIVSMLSLCSFPTTIQFFCEVNMVKLSIYLLIVLCYWVFYLFFSGIIPLVLCGYLLIRSEFFEDFDYSHYSFNYFLFFVGFWCYVGILFL
uniref:NADH-ubiquinone oxidoreductase chain 4 n=1 Tax=Dipylidium caninum TaxID=66787 RepID=A0A7H9SNJ5_DIPCN|nr:NADH dehydrogenase subunit 4 [Dipylidium caninum]